MNMLLSTVVKTKINKKRPGMAIFKNKCIAMVFFKAKVWSETVGYF